VRRLLVGRPEPHQVRVLDDGVEHHQALDGMAQGDRFAQAAVGLADGGVERSLVQVIDAGAVVSAVVHGRVLKPDELGEEPPRLLAVHDAAEPCVLARDADAGVEHDGRQKPRLALRKALLRNSLDTFVEGHQSSSSMTLGVRPPPPPRPPRAATCRRKPDPDLAAA
jgi:hypothetical protein